MRVAVVGSGVSGLGAAFALSRVHDVELFETRSRAGGDAYTVLLERVGARPWPGHGLPRPQRSHLSAPDAALPRARRADAGRGDVVLRHLRALRARVVERLALRSASERCSAVLRALPLGDRALPAHQPPRARRRRSRRHHAPCLRGARGVFQGVSPSLPRPHGGRAVVVGHAPGDRDARAARARLLRQPRTAGAEAPALEDGQRRERVVRRRDARPAAPSRAARPRRALDRARTSTTSGFETIATSCTASTPS